MSAEMGGKEKIVWILILLVFLLFQFRALDKKLARNDKGQGPEVITEKGKP